LVEPEPKRKDWLAFVRQLRSQLSPHPREDWPEILMRAHKRSGRPTKKELEKLQSEPFWLARPKQRKILRSDADTVLAMSGRSWGKTWAGSHWIIEQARRRPGEDLLMAGETAGDVRDLMIEGQSGVLSVAPGGWEPDYSPSKRKLTFPNGATVTLRSGDKPAGLRGPTVSAVWLDELAKMRFSEDVWDQAEYVARESDHPQILITTTPRPGVVADIKDLPETETIGGPSWENERNMPERFKRKLRKAENTRMGRQEVFAEILDNSGDLWSAGDISHCRPQDVPELKRVVIGLDPSVSDQEGDECGIVVAGIDASESAYVLFDASGQYSTREWSALVCALHSGRLERAEELLDGTEGLSSILSQSYPWPPADCVHAETNQGGDLIQNSIRVFDKGLALNGTHTQKSKWVRAEPIHSLYQISGKVTHVGQFASPAEAGEGGLEDQMLDFRQDQSDSPDRVDALCYALDELLLDDSGNRDITSYSL